MADHASPRVNYAQHANFVGRAVRITGKVKQMNNNDTVILECSDGGEIEARLQPDHHFDKTYVELIGQVLQPGVLKTMAVINLSDEMDMKVLDYACKAEDSRKYILCNLKQAMDPSDAFLSPYDTQRYLTSIIANSAESRIVTLSIREAQQVLDEIWKVLDSQALPKAASSSEIADYRNTLRRLSTKIALHYQLFPTTLILHEVQHVDTHQRMMGGFADVFVGLYRGSKVALKTLRSDSSPYRGATQQHLKLEFFRESLLWRALVHENVLAFLGVAEDVISHGSISMVIPWMENGSARHYVKALLDHCTLSDEQLTATVDHWLRQTACGLEYLHSEGVIHGDLHGGNILLDHRGQARLSDFGLSLIAEATAYNYGSVHGGGAIRWLAPELMAPEEFGLESSRPTTLSDVYSFACTCVELYSGRPPLHEYYDFQLFHRVVEGTRPTRPVLPGESPMPDEIWSLTVACWSRIAADRPPAKHVAENMSSITKQHREFVLPELPDDVRQESPVMSSDVSTGSNRDAQLTVDGIWKLMLSPSWKTAAEGPVFCKHRANMLRLGLKMCLTHDVFPSALNLRGVKCTLESQRGAGPLGDVFVGTYGEFEVAVKRLRTQGDALKADQEELKRAFHREALVWSSLQHEHILSFLGMSKTTFPGTLSLVSLWMEKGNITDFTRSARREGRLEDGTELSKAFLRWMHQVALGLAYLHCEGVFHANLRGNNVLIDDSNSVRLTDFTLSILDNTRPYQYASIHGGGAYRWLAPELIDPEEFDLTTTRATACADIFSFAYFAIEVGSLLCARHL
ncbi:hypothetical protein EIP91_002084 [Steccherinum ochraceum]|uniref:Protein kinase domain-containing protein n=1 Tax=Steccherinum ochraceum TaxID=92696 RepID=A0A4R0S0V2_9APHY|nr:hypothetical protein EIP91_002084 [Steccherinum ochraceum]